MRSVEREGVRIAFTDEGEGPALVLGHSFLCSGAMWAPQLPALTASYRVVNVDYRGHGASGPAEDAFTLDDMVDDVLAVLDRLGIERAAWVGLSIGGMVSLRAALAAPERVAGLVLLDTGAGGEPWGKRLEHRVLGLGTRLLGMRPLLPAILRILFGASTRRDRPALVREWGESIAAAHLPSMLRTLTALNRRDSVADRLGEIAVPTAVIVGAEDRARPPAESRELAEGIPGATFTVVPAAGHLSSLERPKAITAAILEALARIFPPGQAS